MLYVFHLTFLPILFLLLIKYYYMLYLKDLYIFANLIFINF